MVNSDQVRCQNAKNQSLELNDFTLVSRCVRGAHSREDDGGGSEMDRAFGDGEGGFFHGFGERRVRVTGAREVFGRA
jgi:hypothetical protein